MKLFKKIFISATFIFFISPSFSSTIVDFSDLSIGDNVTSQYENQGLVISGWENGSEVFVSIKDWSGDGIVDTRAITNCYNSPTNSCDAWTRADILRLTFTNDVENLSFIVDSHGGGGSYTVTLEAYDFDNILLETIIVPGTNEQHLVSFTSTNIARVDGLQPSDNWGWGMDNLSFTTSDQPAQSQTTPIEFSFSSDAIGFEGVGIGCDISLDIPSTSALPVSPVSIPVSIPELVASTQHVYISSNTKSEDGTQAVVKVTYNAEDATLTGLTLRIHYDSSAFTLSDISDVLSSDLFIPPTTSPTADTDDFDNDASTDSYVLASWLSLFAIWPNSVPADLMTLTFDIAEGATGISAINFTSEANHGGYTFDGQDHIINYDTSATSQDNCGTPGYLSNQQALYVASSTIVGSQKYVRIGYSSDYSSTTGLGLRVHYESDKLSLNKVIDILQTDYLSMNDQNEDTNNYDEDTVTDKYIAMGWASFFGSWPGANSANLATLVFDINEYEAPEPPTQPQQVISVNNTPKGVLGRTSVLEVAYDTTDNNNQLSGLGMRVHFDSSLLSFNEITGLIEQDIIVSGEGPFSDDADFDNDPLTDQYMLFGWASLYNNWPDTDLPTILMNIAFDVSANINPDLISSTSINFTDTSFTAGYELSAESYELEILRATWDFDGNGQADALTDGLMMLRYLFGLRGDLVTNSAMSPESPLSSDEIVSEIEAAMAVIDIDADSNQNALTDGLLLLRYLFGLRDDSLTSGAVGPDATRSSNSGIENYLESHMPAM